MSPSAVPTAKLNGVELEAGETIGWTLSQGTQPHQRVFEVDRRRAPELLPFLGKEVTLEVTLGARSDKYKRLTLMCTAAATSPQRIAFLVSDKRWKWKNVAVRADLNFRRRTGEIRILNGDVRQIIAPVLYAAFSVQSAPSPNVPWNAKTALKYLFGLVDDDFQINDEDLVASVDIDGFVCREAGDVALDRIFHFIPGLTCYVDENGKTRTTNRFSGAEEGELATAGTALEDTPIETFLDLSGIRASGVDVYFPCQDEVRFDFVDPPVTTSGISRFLENVLPLPDSITFTSGPRKGQTVAQGTWVPIDQDLLNAWNAAPFGIDDAGQVIAGAAQIVIGGVVQQFPTFNFPDMRRLFLYPGGYNLYLEFDPTNRIGPRRWNAFMQHYRQTFRLPPAWADRSFGFDPTRLSIVDPVTGTRAPADVAADIAVIPTIHRIAFGPSDPTLQYQINVYAWPPGTLDPHSNPIATAKLVTEAFLVPVDPDVFVFKIVFKQLGSHLNDTLTILPSAVADVQTGDPPAPKADIGQAAVSTMLHAAGLASQHRFSTILTLASASPQGLDGFYKVPLAPDDVKPLLPKGAAANLGKCNGPRKAIIVGSDVMTADSYWDDLSADQISNRIVNGKGRDPNKLIYPDHLMNTAKSFAAAHWITQVDRWEGARISVFNPGAHPVGRIQQVIHALAPNGEFTTELDMSPDLKPPSWMAFLPEDTRRKIFRKIPAGKRSPS